MLGSHTIVPSLSRCLLTYPGVVPHIIPSATHSRRRWCRCVNWPSFSSLLTAVHFRRTTGPSKSPSTSSMLHDGSNSLPNSNPNPSQTHQHHCERCYDPDPIRCRSAIVIALFAFVIVSHNSHSPQVDALHSLDACRSPEVWRSSEGRHYTTRWNAGDVRTTRRESTTDPIHVLPTDSTSSARSLLYIHYYLRTSYISSCVS